MRTQSDADSSAFLVDLVPSAQRGFELTDIMLAEVDGVEVYTPATVPAQFKSPGNAAGRSDCGVLVIWRRTGAR